MRSILVFLLAVLTSFSTLGDILSVVETGLGGDAAAIIENGTFGEDALTFSDRTHQHNGAAYNSADGLLSTSGDVIVPIPSYLVGADYVRFANNARENIGYSAEVTASEPYDWYLMIDNRGDGPNANPNGPNTTDPVLGGTFQWVLDGGWVRVNTGIMPNGQADYTGIDESGNGVGPGAGLNQFYAIYTLENQTSVTVGNNGFSGNMIALAGKPTAMEPPSGIISVVETGIGGDTPAVIEHGSFGEDALFFSDRTHQHNGAAYDSGSGLLSTSGDMIVPLPDYLVGGDYVRFANNARDNAGYSAVVTASESFDWYLLIDNRGDGLAGNTSSPNSTDPVLGGTFQWVLDGGWARVNTGLMPNGQADYTAIDESGDGVGPGVGLNQFFAVYTLENRTSVKVGNNGFSGNMISLVGKPTTSSVPKPKILLVSDNAYAGSRAGTGDPEAAMQSFLEELGYEVIRATGEGGSAQFKSGNEGAAGAQAIIASQGVSLVIVSRVTNSGDYNDPAGWNSIEVPVFLVSPYLTRSSRWLWVNSGDVNQDALTDLVFVEPAHPFVAGLNTDIFTTATSFSRNPVSDAGNGTVIATTAEGHIAIVEWQAGVEFYPNSGQVPAGRRVHMGGLRYHEDDGNGDPIFFDAYSENGLAILAQIIRNLAPLPGGGGYQEPQGGWAYKFDGDSGDPGSSAAGAFDALDGTWGHDNPSDAWDGTAIGAGSPGGLSALDDQGTTFVRIQDTGDPRDHGFGGDPSNRKVSLVHRMDGDGVTGDILGGFTLSFRARLATTPPLDDVFPDGGGTPQLWPAEGAGELIHDGGKGNISVFQGNLGGVAFSFATENDPNSSGVPLGQTGLIMNSLNGSAVSGSVDPWDGEGTLNILPLDLTEWHEYWINIEADASGGGTHRVDVYLDGSTVAESFHVTAGNGSDDGANNYLAMGSGATPQFSAFDVDFVAFKDGIHEPVPAGAGSPVGFELQPISITVNENDPAMFTAIVTGTPPRTLQWQRDGVDIPGATEDTYVIDQAQRSEIGRASCRERV